MTREALLEMLADAGGKKSKGGATFELADQDEVAMLFVADGGLMTIGRVQRVDVRNSYCLVEANRSEVYLLALERVAGLKLRRAEKSGAGFVV